MPSMGYSLYPLLYAVNFKDMERKFNKDEKLKSLKSYIYILKNSDSYIENIGLVDDSQLKKDSMNIDTAINYFTIIHNFLIIERMYSSEVKQANKELNKYLQVKKMNNIDDVLEEFFKLYDINGKVRLAVETFGSIENIRVFLKNRESVYRTLM
jgi:hypothetical protein